MDGVVARPARRSRWRSARARRQAGAALAMLAPTLVLLVTLRLLPAVRSAADSLTATSLLTGATRFVGLDNYEFLLHSAQFHRTVGVTLLFTVVVNPLQILLALALAVLLNERLPAVGIWRTLVFLPVAAPAAASAVIWGIAMRPDGPLNAVLAVFGIGRQPFLNSRHQALWSIIVVLSWIGVGYWMIFLIAGLKDIPEEHYEALRVDGGNRWQAFRHITLPGLRRPLAFVLVADTVANFTVFAPVQILTEGGPENSTNLLIYDIYQQAYVAGDTNLAAAEVVILVLIMLAVVSVQFRLLSRVD